MDKTNLVLCIPGIWKDRTAFVSSVAAKTRGEFLFAGGIMLHVASGEHALTDFVPADPDMRGSFEVGGKGKISGELLQSIEGHNGAAVLRFGPNVVDEREKLARFSKAMKDCGGLAVKVDSAGVAHEWDPWFAMLSSTNPFDLYRNLVVLVGGSNSFYSCGMHQFDLPDVELDHCISAEEAADVMNRFNYWRIIEKPKLAPGHTFSITKDAPTYRVTLKSDTRHRSGHPYHNEKGIWSLEALFVPKPS